MPVNVSNNKGTTPKSTGQGGAKVFSPNNQQQQKYGFECSHCGEPILGDTHALVRHLVTCRAVSGGDSALGAHSPPHGGPHSTGGGIGSGHRATNASGGSGASGDASSAWSLFKGGSTARRDYVSEELAILEAVYSDTLTVLVFVSVPPCAYEIGASMVMLGS